MNPTNTFVIVADDCPAEAGVVPAAGGGKQTVASLEYELLSQRPYAFTLEDLILEVHLRRAGISPEERAARGAQIRAELFSKPHPCLRASPLTKRYGFGAHYDEGGRLAIYPRGSPEYQRLSASRDLAVVKAMRNRRDR